MRRDVRILLATLAVGGLWAARPAWSEAVSEMELFRITDVRVHGLRHVDRDDVLERLALAPESTIWGDVTAWTEALEGHPLVRRARVRRRIPGRLDVEIVERTPIALVATPLLEPVDADGARLPLDPAAHRLDLPLLLLAQTPAAGWRLLPESVRTLAYEVARLGGADTSFSRMASEVAWHDAASLVVRWTTPQVDIVLPRGASAARVADGLTVLGDALARRPDRPPRAIDLRYADQVVVRGTR